MNIVHNERGKVTIVLNADEVYPIGGIDRHELIELVSERYNFKGAPNISENGNQIRLENGRLLGNDKKIVVYEMVIYNDGLSVVAPNTDLANFIIADAIQFGTSAFGLRPPQTKPYYI